MWWIACIAAYANDTNIVEDLSDTLPGNGAVGVPIDARMVALTRGAAPYDLDVVDDAGAVLAATTWDGAGGVGVLTPPDGLPADTALTLRVTYGTTGVLAAAMPFTTGTGRVQGIEGLPEVVGFAAARSRRSTFVSLDVVPAVDPDDLSLLRASFEDSVTFEVAAEGGYLSYLGLSVPRRDLDEICVDVVQIDARGRETAPVVACAEVSRGCATGPGGGAAAVLVAAAGAIRRPGDPGKVPSPRRLSWDGRRVGLPRRAQPNGSNSVTPDFSKSRRFLVTRTRPCASAVAAIMLSLIGMDNPSVRSWAISSAHRSPQT